MMPIINIHPLASEADAEAFRLTLKDADKFGLYCMYNGTNAMWSVIPKIALDLIFNAETALPVTERTWVGLTEEDLKLLSAEWRIVYGAWMDDFARDIEAKLKEKNS